MHHGAKLDLRHDSGLLAWLADTFYLLEVKLVSAIVVGDQVRGRESLIARSYLLHVVMHLLVSLSDSLLLLISSI